jgi:hypothetical protein
MVYAATKTEQRSGKREKRAMVYILLRHDVKRNLMRTKDQAQTLDPFSYIKAFF